MAFSTSPGLEICERSILGAMACEARDGAALAWPPGREPRSYCARTFCASCSSSELEWVLPPARPSSAKMSRTWLLLTSISRASSLIRTLLIRLFSKCATQSPLVAHSYLMAMAVHGITIIRLTVKSKAHVTRRPLWPPAHLQFRLLSRSLPTPHRHRGRSQLPLQPRGVSLGLFQPH